MIIKSNKPSKEKTKSIVHFIGNSATLADTVPTEPTSITTISTSHVFKK